MFLYITIFAKKRNFAGKIWCYFQPPQCKYLGLFRKWPHRGSFLIFHSEIKWRDSSYSSPSCMRPFVDRKLTNDNVYHRESRNFPLYSGGLLRLMIKCSHLSCFFLNLLSSQQKGHIKEN